MLVEKNTVAVVARLLLQRERNQIAESSPRQRVLIRKKPVVGVQADLRVLFHGFGQQVRSELSGERGWNRLFEEQPHVPATTGAGPLERSRNIHPAAGLEEGRSIFAPILLVKVDREEETRLILEDWIDARHERLPLIVVPEQMPPNHLIGNRKEAAMGTLDALDPWLFANASHPFVRAGGRIPGFARFPALEATRVDVITPAEERSEQGDLGLGWGQLMDGT